MDSQKDQDGKLNYFTVEGTRYRTALSKKFNRRKAWEPEDPNQITAAIPGTILKICVKEGQKVSEGKCIFILEAMKMKNRFNAPKGGVVKKIHVEEGEVIAKKHLIMELSDEEPVKTSKSRSRGRSRSK